MPLAEGTGCLVARSSKTELEGSSGLASPQSPAEPCLLPRPAVTGRSDHDGKEHGTPERPFPGSLVAAGPAFHHGPDPRRILGRTGIFVRRVRFARWRGL